MKIGLTRGYKRKWRRVEQLAFYELKKAMKKGWQFELQEGERSIVDRVRIWLTEKCHLVALFTMLLSPLTHHKCCQKDIPQKYLKNHPLYTVTVTTNSPQVMPKGYHKWMKNLTLSTLLLSPQVLSKGLWVKKFKNVSLFTLLLLPLIHHKCYQKADDYKNWNKFSLSTLLLLPLIHYKCFPFSIITFQKMARYDCPSL